ncbi:MAG: carboxypeptidase-like regulatory domain-containing protein [Bacteroidales bacterium]
MKFFLFLALFCATSFVTNGQVITGKVLDKSDNKPLVYVNIGAVETTHGAISDEHGYFSLDVKGLPDSSIIRFSMIGYTSRTYKLKDLLIEQNIILLEVNPVKLSEVIIKPSGKPMKIGTTNSSIRGICGWGGTSFGKGHELGLKLKLGPSLVKISSLHMKLSMQAFDSSLFRLHIRDLKEGLPDNELLNKEIFIAVVEKSGWIDVDLSQHNIVLKEDIVLSLEWIKVDGLHKERLLRIDDADKKSANVLFCTNNKKGTFFIRKGSEAKWLVSENESPVFYIRTQ